MTRRPLHLLVTIALLASTLATGLPLAAGDEHGAANVATEGMGVTYATHVMENEDVVVDLTVNYSGSGAASPAGMLASLVVTLPEGATLHEDMEDAPPGWATTRYARGDAPHEVTFTAITPMQAGEDETFRVRVESLPCDDGLASFEWRVVGGERVPSATVNQLEVTLPQTCDQRLPAYVNATEDVTTSTAVDGYDLFANFTDDSPLAVVAELVKPDGTAGDDLVFEVDGGAARARFPITPADVGEWTYVLKATDAAGNVRTSPAYAIDVADATAPTITLTAPETVEAGDEVEVGFTVEDNVGVRFAALAMRAYNAADALVLEETEELDLTALDGGTLTFQSPRDALLRLEFVLNATDAAGNEEPATKPTALVDTTTPTLLDATFSSEAGDDGWHEAVLSVTLDAQDAGTPGERLAIHYVVEREDVEVEADQGVAGMTVTLSGPGNYTLTYRARDEAGLESEPVTHELKVDPDVPSGTFDGLPDGWATSPVTIRFIPATQTSGATFAWFVDGVQQGGDSRLFDVDGAYALSYEGTSGAGLVGTGSVTLGLDQTDPTVDVVIAGPGDEDAGVFRDDATVTATGADATSGVERVEVYVDGVKVAEGAPVATATVGAAGEHVVRAVARDAAGHEVESAERTILIDRDAPALRLLVNGTEPAGDAPVVLNWSARVEAVTDDEDVVAFACTLDGAEVDVAGGLLLDAGGVFTVACAPVDAAGNAGDEVAVAVLVDRAGPAFAAAEALGATRAAPFLAPVSDPSGVARLEARYVSEATTTPAALAFDETAGAWSLAEAPALADGEHALELRATDAHGWTSDWTTVATFRIVTQTPTPAFDREPGAQAWTRDAWTLSWTIPDGPVPARMTVRVGDGAPVPATSPYAVDVEGVTTLAFQVVDDLGNVGEAAKFVVRVDRTGAPVAPTAPDATATNAASHVLALAPQDDGFSPAGVEASVDGGAYAPAASVTLEAEGRHVVMARTRDEVGNVGPARTFVVVIDRTAPNATAGDLVLGGPDGRVSWSAQDALSGVAGVEATLLLADDTETPLAASLGGADLSGLPEGRHRVRVVPVDAAGNRGAPAEANVTADFTPPQVALPPLPAFVNRPFLVSVAASDAGSGVARVALHVTDAAGTRTLEDDEAPFDLAVDPKHGDVSLRAEAFDRVGRSASTPSAGVAADGNAPVIELATNPHRDGVFEGRFEATARAVDDRDGAPSLHYALCDDSCGGTSLFPGTLVVDAPGRYALTLVAYDAAGNEGRLRFPFLVVAASGSTPPPASSPPPASTPPPAATPPAQETPTEEPTDEEPTEDGLTFEEPIVEEPPAETTPPQDEPEPEPRTPPAQEPPAPSREVRVVGPVGGILGVDAELTFEAEGLAGVTLVAEDGTRVPLDGLRVRAADVPERVVAVEYAWADGETTREPIDVVAARALEATDVDPDAPVDEGSGEDGKLVPMPGVAPLLLGVLALAAVVGRRKR